MIKGTAVSGNYLKPNNLLYVLLFMWSNDFSNDILVSSLTSRDDFPTSKLLPLISPSDLCVCTHTHVCMHVYTCVHVHHVLHVCTYVYLYVFVHVCMCVHVCLCVYACMFICMCACVCVLHPLSRSLEAGSLAEPGS